MRRILCILLSVLIFQNLHGQAVTKYGENTSSGTDFVNQHGETGIIPALTIYGEILPLCSDCGTIADADGNVYNTVQIGNQCWMQENLKTTKFSDGTDIPLITDDATWAGLSTPAYCWYNNDVSYKNLYGGLYNWFTVNAGNVCPAGWHVPTEAEYNNLMAFLGGSDIAGGKLKEAGTAHWQSPNTGATNQFCFSALPGGKRGYQGTFRELGTGGKWWTSDEYSDDNAFEYAMVYLFEYVVLPAMGKKDGNSIRCIKNSAVSAPTLNTQNPTDITSTSATSGGDITSDGGAEVTSRGVCWARRGYLTIEVADHFTVDGPGTGVFTSFITGLMPETWYYLRAYATNSAGTAYGKEIRFKTPAVIPDCGTVTDIDGNLYNTVQIGDQCWMRENLKTTRYRNGDLIGTTSPATLDISGEPSSKYQWSFDGNESNVTDNGRLYTWYTVVDGRNLCPAGWHVPRDNEWIILEEFLTNNGYGFEESGNDIGKSMATTSGWMISSTPGFVGNDLASNNSSGFSGKPGGARHSTGLFNLLGSYGIWWSATEYSNTIAKLRMLRYDGWFLEQTSFINKNDGYSVRCINGEYTLPTLTTANITSINSTSAISGGNITTDGGSAVIARGVCWGMSYYPTIADNKTVNGSGIGTFSSSITGLTLGETYYVRAYATNANGTAYGAVQTFQTVYGVGDSYQGGIIGFIYQPGDPGYVPGQVHGIIAAPSDQSSSILWGPQTTYIGATGTALGTGNTNTVKIVTAIPFYAYPIPIAARLCYDLVLNGYSDWFLPSRDELIKLRAYKTVIGGFANNVYWSSTEVNSGGGIVVDFSSAFVIELSKGYYCRVRAIRTF